MKKSIYALFAVLLTANICLSYRDEDPGVERLRKEGYTDLHLAITRGTANDIENLLSQGADVNAKDNSGTTPLHNAAFFANTEAAQVLTNHGAQVDVQNIDGSTPLHYAAGNPHSKEIVKLLLEKGANKNIRNSRSQTPHDIAQSAGHVEIANLLS